jgi:membrane protease YdiL (CAAX protease family)
MEPVFYSNPEQPAEPAPSSSPDLKAARCRFSRLGLGLTVLVAVMMAVALVMEFAVILFAPQYATAWWMTWVISLVPLYAAALPCLYLVFKGIPVAPHNTLCTIPNSGTQEKPRFHFGHWTVLLIISQGCMYIGSLIGNGLMQIMSNLMDYDYANPVNDIIKNSPTWMVFFATCICAPFGEELIFRKLLLDRTRGYGETASILLSGLLFGLFHGNLFQFFYAFLIGMLLAYVYTRSGSYLWCVAMHATVNLFGSVIVPALLKLLPEGVPEDPLQILLALAIATWQYGLIVAAMVLLIVLWRQRKLSRGSCPLDPRGTVSVILLNPGIIAAATVMFILLLSNLILPLIPAG